MSKFCRYIILIFVSTLFISYLFAEEKAEIKQDERLEKPRNPFMAFYEVDKEQEQIEEVAGIIQEPQIKICLNLTGVLQGRQTFAIINDGIAKIGDIIYGYIIKHIGRDFVVVEREGEEITLQLLTR